MNANGHHPTPVASLELIQAGLNAGTPKTLPEFLADKERNIKPPKPINTNHETRQKH